MQSSFRIGRIAGIDIGIHYTWFFVFFLFTWSLASGFFPATYPGWAPLTYWLTGAITALALFACVLIHELSHALVARRRGQQVQSITLFIFGGVANLQGELASAGDEFVIAAVGPLASLVLAGLFWLASLAVPATSGPAGAVLAYLAIINLALAIFNLIPGFPLDGGRVLRSILWGATGSLRRATDIASYVGQAIGWLLIFWGVWQLLGGAIINGLWIAFIGWFLNSAAEQARQQQVVQSELAGVRVADVMHPQPAVGTPLTSVEEFMLEQVLRRGQRALLVTNNERLVGIVTVTDAKELPQSAWATTPISDIMTRAPLKTVRPDQALTEVVARMAEDDVNQLPVVEDERVVGLLSRSDIIRWLRFRQTINQRPGGGRRPVLASAEGR